MLSALVAKLAVVSIWAPLIYQYTVGGLLFVLGITLSLRSRACDLKRANDRFWLAVLFVGIGVYFAVHLTVYLLAIFVLPNAAGVSG